MTVMQEWDMKSEGQDEQVGPDTYTKLTGTRTIDAGKYMINYTARLNGNKVGNKDVSTKWIEAWVEITGPGIPGGTYTIDGIKFFSQGNDEIRKLAGFIPDTLESGEFTLAMKYRAEDATQTVRIDKARMQIIKY